MKRTTLFVRSSLILTLTLFSSLNLSYASDHLEDEEVQPQSLSKAVTRHSQELPTSYGDFDQLSEDLLFHQILPRCDRTIIQVNRSLFTLVTGYESDHIFDQGFEYRPTKPICCLHGHTVLDFTKTWRDTKQMPSFVWSLTREAIYIPSSLWSYLKGSQIHTVNLSGNHIGNDGARTIGQDLQGTQVHTVNLSWNKIGDNGARDFSQYLQDTQVQTVDLGNNQIGTNGARAFGQNLRGTQVHTVNLSYNEIDDDGARAFGQHLQGTQVHTINLKCTKIDDAGAKALVQVLKGTQVQTLDLSWNGITEDMRATLRQLSPNITLIFDSSLF